MKDCCSATGRCRFAPVLGGRHVRTAPSMPNCFSFSYNRMLHDHTRDTGVGNVQGQAS